MADIKLSQLGVITTLADEDLILVSQSAGGGSFISKAITVLDFKNEIGGGDDATNKSCSFSPFGCKR